MTRDPKILREGPDEWAAELARLRAAIGEPAELRDARAGDVITIPGHFPRQVTVESVTYAGMDFAGREFSWIAWMGPGARGREWYSDRTQIRIVSRADHLASDDNELADLRAQLTEGESDG